MAKSNFSRCPYRRPSFLEKTGKADSKQAEGIIACIIRDVFEDFFVFFALR